MYAKDVQLVVLQHHPSCTNIVVPISKTTNGDVRWVGEKDRAKRACSVKTKLNTHVK